MTGFHGLDGPRPPLLLRWAVLLVAAVCLPSTALLAGDIENDICAGCHEDIAEAFSQTAHGVYFSTRPALADYGCESCHGSGIEHVENPVADNIINPANTDQFGSSMLCQSCHNDRQFDDWPFSEHHAAGVNCASCHNSHSAYTAENALTKDVPELCYDCHAEVRAETRMPSHHPIAEGKLDCRDCHNPHGGPARLTQDATGRELCFSCHANIEGPFVYEHAPVNEDCGLCHKPHGSVANNLLVQNEPTLCLNCHAMHFHATVESTEGPFEVPQDRSRDSYSTEDGWKRGMLTRCTSCHTAVHGSDMPSQSISTGGNALTR
ncbi:DmsE family decaheme c-type cytochrome [candidate division GN15 bacterium]|nr:DmsE family decaheme c-type cytochrome [candidate division GN15 bacterium]